MDYSFPEGQGGIGSDIRWCNRHRGGKRCQLCTHHAKFEEWSTKWHWFYLLSWYDCGQAWYKLAKPGKYAYCYYTSNWHGYLPWARHGKKSWWGRVPRDKQPNPKRYSTYGLDEKEFRSLLRKGCKNNKKCKCISLIQRGNWYCPECYKDIILLAHHRKCNLHDIMVANRKEIKQDILILRLSGVL